MRKVAVVGCGVVGASWGVVFSRAGLDVTLYDPSEASRRQASEFILDTLAEAAAGSAPTDRPGSVVVADTLAEAVGDADYVQESAPERVEVKRELYRTLDGLVPPGAVIGSSTSGLPASAFTDGLVTASRCLVVHPINPPHLIPLVEIVPAPWTAASAVDRAVALMESVRQSPIPLSREINGFVVNRLQSALLGEAFRLVEDGIVSATDVDKAVADGLGLRWFFMGPFETIDLNAANGIAEYCSNLGPMYYGLAREQADPREWSEELVRSVEEQRRAVLPSDQLAMRRTWRDRCLAAFVTMKAKLAASS